jgi:hypothetical protein
VRASHRKIEAVRKKPAISHQPPSFSGGMLSPYFGAGGSRANQGSWRMNSMALQFTEASMFRPMISKAMKPNSRDRVPRPPR